MSAPRFGMAALVMGLTAMAILAGVWLGSGDPYVLRAELKQAQGLIEGNSVRVEGAEVGSVKSLELDRHDHVVAELELDKSAATLGQGETAPAVGRNAKVTVRTLDLFGERYLDLDPGDTRRLAPSGMTIPPGRTYVSVELDDVLNTLDLSTREALAVFIDEQGAAVVGRGNDLASLLRALPSSLDKTGTLVNELSADNRALGRLIEESDRVVGTVARERTDFGRVVDNAATTLDTLASRRRDLGETVERAPTTLASARRTLDELQGAMIPLTPAARGLRRTAPALTETLHELPGFAEEARPTLRTLRRVSPSLGRLGREGTPVVARLRPLTTELETFAEVFDPFTEVLEAGWPDQLAILEGWARSTQVRDRLSQVFRFGAAGVDDQTTLVDFIEQVAKGKRPLRGALEDKDAFEDLLKRAGKDDLDLSGASISSTEEDGTGSDGNASEKQSPAPRPGDGSFETGPPEPGSESPSTGAPRALLDYLLAP